MNTRLLKHIFTGTVLVLLITSCDTDLFKKSTPSAPSQETTKSVEKKTPEAKKEPVFKEVKPATAAEKQALLSALKNGLPPEKKTPQFIPDTLRIKQLPKDPNSLFAKLKTKASEVLNIDLWEKKYVINGVGLCGTNKAVIINKKTVLEGAEVSEGILLQNVSLTYAIIVHEGTEYLIRPKSIQSIIDKKSSDPSDRLFQ